MARNLTRKRPWLAVFLAALGTGFGHLYLRRWARAIGWVVVAVGAVVLLVPEAALEAFALGGEFAWLDIAPLVIVSAVSALDAYQLAVVNNYVVRTHERTAGAIQSCPECGRPLDDDLEFCHWCSVRLPEVANTDETAENGDPERFPFE